MNILIAVLCLAAVIALCVLAIRRGSNDGGYRRRFENRYRHDSTPDPVSPSLWVTRMGTDVTSSHHVPDAGGHCHSVSDGGGGCGDGGSS